MTIHRTNNVSPEVALMRGLASSERWETFIQSLSLEDLRTLRAALADHKLKIAARLSDPDWRDEDGYRLDGPEYRRALHRLRTAVSVAERQLIMVGKRLKDINRETYTRPIAADDLEGADRLIAAAFRLIADRMPIEPPLSMEEMNLVRDMRNHVISRRLAAREATP